MRAIGMVLTALQVRVEKNKATRANLEDRYEIPYSPTNGSKQVRFTDD